jgi:hypothetical protein
MADPSGMARSIVDNGQAGIECEHDGNYPVTPELVLKKIDSVERQVRYDTQGQ